MSVRTEHVGTEDSLLASSLAYRVLSQAFAYPRPDTIAQLRREDLPLALAAAAAMPPLVSEGLRSTASELEDATTESLEASFRDLFTHVHSADCPMYETDYGARDVWRQSSVLVDVAGFYRAFGVEERAERPDHVAAELEFLHMVTYKQAWAAAHGDRANRGICRDAEVAFLRDHALRWIPGFAARVEALAGGGPYAAAARTTRALLLSEADRHGLEVIEDVVPEPVLPPMADETPSPCEVDG